MIETGEPSGSPSKKKKKDIKMKNWEKMVDMIKEAYIKTMGAEKWNSLTDTEKHDAVMTIAKDMNRMLGA